MGGELDSRFEEDRRRQEPRLEMLVQAARQELDDQEQEDDAGHGEEAGDLDPLSSHRESNRGPRAI